MKYIFKLVLISALFLFGAVPGSAQSKQVRIACVGNSITYGSGLKDRSKESYPAQLQALLGHGYEVMNFGVSGATMLRKGSKPYWNTPEYAKVMESNPNLVLIKLGTNDSKLVNRPLMSEYEKDYREMVQQFLDLPTKPRVVLLLPIKAFSEEKFGISGKYLKDSIIPMIQAIAYEKNLEVLDLYSLFADQEALFADKIHPNAEGDGIIARRLYDFILQNQPVIKELKSGDVSKKINGTDLVRSCFYGYQAIKFSFNGREARIVMPKHAAKDLPWVWRARFWGHEPQTDIALLERGYHIVYCDVAELFGNAQAITIWNDFYAYLRKMGFARKAVLEGMSRGGVYAYNWAAVNPDKVACVYADNPVLDLKSWPGGKGIGPGSKKEWQTFLTDFGYQNEEEAKAFAGSPIDKIKEIVKGKYPMLHVCGDLDELVPMSENTLPFAEKIKLAGGDIQIIHKPEGKHHPHSLANPTAIVEFILKNSNK